jgi:hypothetical protein
LPRSQKLDALKTPEGHKSFPVGFVSDRSRRAGIRDALLCATDDADPTRKCSAGAASSEKKQYEHDGRNPQNRAQSDLRRRNSAIHVDGMAQQRGCQHGDDHGRHDVSETRIERCDHSDPSNDTERSNRVRTTSRISRHDGAIRAATNNPGTECAEAYDDDFESAPAIRTPVANISFGIEIHSFLQISRASATPRERLHHMHHKTMTSFSLKQRLGYTLFSKEKTLDLLGRRPWKNFIMLLGDGSHSTLYW